MDDRHVKSKTAIRAAARAERQAETRRRIVDATVALHEEIGPARAAVAEIARRAGVARLTVYNHFPEDADLFAACRGAFLAPQSAAPTSARRLRSRIRAPGCRPHSERSTGAIARGSR